MRENASHLGEQCARFLRRAAASLTCSVRAQHNGARRRANIPRFFAQNFVEKRCFTPVRVRRCFGSKRTKATRQNSRVKTKGPAPPRRPIVHIVKDSTLVPTHKREQVFFETFTLARTVPGGISGEFPDRALSNGTRNNPQKHHRIDSQALFFIELDGTVGSSEK